MSHIQSQCWICPQCYDDKHHQPGDMHCLRQQKSEAMAIASLNQMESRKLREELIAAKAEIERLRGRVATQEDALHSIAVVLKGAGNLSKEMHDLIVSATKGSSEAWLLRQKANELEIESKEWREVNGKNLTRGFSPDFITDEIYGRVKHLRQQAEAAEKGGDDEPA